MQMNLKDINYSKGTVRLLNFHLKRSFSCILVFKSRHPFCSNEFSNVQVCFISKGLVGYLIRPAQKTNTPFQS